MEDSSEGFKEEQDRKPVFDSRSCPQCGNKVGWKRLRPMAWTWSKWECPVCSSLLTFDFERRVVVSLVAVPLALFPTGLIELERWYLAVAWILLVFLYAFTFERIKIARPGAERPWPRKH